MSSHMRNELRASLPPLPKRMSHLPVDRRGFPTPFFIDWNDGDPDFRIIGAGKIEKCWNRRLCWTCGEPLGRFSSFVIGPMCVFNRTSAEPPSHLDCARFAAKACPFLTQPKMRRNEKGLPEDHIQPAGEMIRRNPGACAIWNSRDPHAFRVPNGTLFNIGSPATVEWYAEGRTATRAEVLESIRTGLPFLLATMEQEPDREGAVREFLRRAIQAGKTLPPGDGEIDLSALQPAGAA